MLSGTHLDDVALSHARQASAPAGHTSVPSLLILGTDAVLAARPATAVQLAHACGAAGFDAVIPASWGDEIVAHRVAQRAALAVSPVVQCSCPLVARRLAEHGDALTGMLLHVVPPPVAAARYLRALYRPTPVRLTYAGDCPLAPSGDLDAQLSCAGLLELLSERGVSVLAQPTEFDSVIPPDRRRHVSEPGGVPARDALQRIAPHAHVVELNEGEFAAALAQHLLRDDRDVIDVATALGCRCSGAVRDVLAGEARARVRAHEPPRAPSPVVNHDVPVFVDEHVSEGRRSSTHIASPADEATLTSSEAAEQESEPALVATDVTGRRRSPPGTARAVLGAMPLSRAERGRQLPRLYVARRRSSPRGLRQSAVRREVPSAAPLRASRPHWLWIAALGVLAGVLLTLALVSRG